MRVRNANLDVLRCLAMFLIVLSHMHQYDGFGESAPVLKFAIGTLTIWHVDAFLSLSGWFGVKFKLGKFLRLWGLIAFYSAVSILVGRFVMGEPTRLAITGGWYGDTYLCLMLVAPLLNAGIEGLLQKGARTAWLAWGGFAAVMLVNWLSRNSYVGFLAYDIAPFTLVQMVFVYFTVRMVRLTGIYERFRLWHAGVVLAVFAIGCCVFRGGRTNYIAPHVIAMAVALLLTFEKFVRVPSWFGRVCVWAAPSMFSIYLLHEVSSFGKCFHRVPVAWLTQRGVPQFAAILCGAIACFAICLTLDVVRRYALEAVRRRLGSWSVEG